jgi:prophage DNA circulation protein
VSAVPPTVALGTGQAIDTSGESWLSSSWWLQLQPGSWRGVGFVMDAAETKAGRRIAEHSYPYRDTIWAEDLGKLPRRFAFQAFLVGDDVYQQRDAMLSACEQAGAATLVHPTLGSVQCVLVDFSTTDRRERGRLVELQFSFVAAPSDQLFPSAIVATGQAISDAADALTSAAGSDLSSALGAVDPIPQASAAFVPGFASLAVGAVNDPLRALNAVAGLPGLYGRYSTGRRTTYQPADATVASCLAASTSSRSAVLDAAAILEAAADAL